MLKTLTSLIDSLTPYQRRLLWSVILWVTLVAIFRAFMHTTWFTIIVTTTFFVLKELFEYGKRRANSKHPHFKK